MKTKPFLLATAGSTVDGRTIDDKMLQEMASSYNPKTYGARLNIEHIRGITGDKPFRAYGDVVELSTAEVDVDFNGKTEKRLGLYGVFDVTDDAKALNTANQKVYPSIEIEPNFAAKGFAYLMGCALTDSPAAIGTDRLEFNRSLPTAIHLTADKGGIAAAALEIAEDGEQATQEAASSVKGFFSKLTEMLSGTAPQPKADPVTPPATPAGFDVAAFATEFGKFGDVMAGALEKQAQGFTSKLDAVSAQVTSLKSDIENTANPRNFSRPLSAGTGGQMDLSQVF
jgi:hypothetical protein